MHGMMERQITHLVRLVDDLMEVSRITRGKFELRLTKIDLADVIRNAVEASTPLIEAGKHQLAISVPDEPLFSKPMAFDLPRCWQICLTTLQSTRSPAAEYG